MQQISFLKNKSLLRRLSAQLDLWFGRLYEWRLNPFASSGTLTTVLLGILIITGLYLLLFYRLGAPYESVVNIQAQVWVGRWVRAVHRYATDLAMIFILFHLFRMFAQGKTWGPRVLAWVSGLVMLGMYCLSAFTGFILVWDRFGLKMAKSWANLVDVLPILPNPLSRAFSGDVTIGTSFFFMNLFLHVAIPLGLAAALWIHTSKLANPKWLPSRKIFLSIFGVLIMVSVFVPAKLDSAANLLEVKGTMIEDYWFSWWIDLQAKIGNGGVLVLFALFWLIGLLAPLWWRPKKENLPPISVHDEEKCEGCQQCYKDCPYEAISMVPRSKGVGSEFVAVVNSMDCTSCGICSGSCSQFAIGPPGRTGREQLLSLKELSKEYLTTPVLYCSNSAEKVSHNSNEILMPFDCLGNMHPGVITLLLNTHKNIILSPCAPDCCEMRMGNQIEWERIFQNREPGLPSRVELNRIIWKQHKPKSGLKSWVLTTVTTAASLFLVAVVSNFPKGTVGEFSYLRLSWRFPIQKIEKCRDLSEAELNARPVHMRVKKECAANVIPYRVHVVVDGLEVLSHKVISPGMRSDRPMLMNSEIPVAPGVHELRVTFTPESDLEVGQLPQVELKSQASFDLGQARLVTLSADQRSLELK